MSRFSVRKWSDVPRWSRILALVLAGIISTSAFSVAIAQSSSPNQPTQAASPAPPVSPTRSVSQVPSPKPTVATLPTLQRVFEQFDTSDINTAFVHLDGYRLFRVATPVTKNSSAEMSSAQQRSQQIEMTLQAVIADNLNADSLNVRSETDSLTNLPVIYVNEQYLMTVTHLDADIQGLQPARASQAIERIVQRAIDRAITERQPEYLWQQGLVAGGVGLVGIVLSVVAVRLKKESRDRQRRFAAALESAKQSTDTDAMDADYESDDLGQQQCMELKLQQRLSVQKLKTRLYVLVHLVIWTAIVAYTVGLFPQTRWLRPLLLATPLRIIAVLVGMYFFVRLGEALIDRLLASILQERQLLRQVTQRLSVRLNTLSQVLKSALALLISGSGVLLILANLGVDLVPVLAGAGIAGLAISFACQSLVKDVINGILILLEDQYAVSDLVKIGNMTGSVETMNLRITQLRDAEGRLITIPNSSIDIVENLSKDWSRVNLTVDVDYRADPDRALQVLKRMAQRMYAESPWSEKIIEPPEVLGIDRLDHVGLQIRIWLKTQPLEQFTVAREFRRRLKLVMADEDLGIGIPQQRLQAQDFPLEANGGRHQAVSNTAEKAQV